MSETKRKDISCVDFAKQIAPFLKIEIKKPSLLAQIIVFSLAIIEHIKYRAGQRRDRKEGIETIGRDEKEIERKLKDAGIFTEEEKGAHEVAVFAGMALASAIFHAGAKHSSFVGEITKTTNKLCWLEERELPLEIRMTEEMFKKILNDAITSGIICLKEDCTVNSDFHEKAAEKLWQEICLRVRNDGQKINVLWFVTVHKDANGMYYMEKGGSGLDFEV